MKRNTILTSHQKLKREIAGFMAVGSLATLIDFLVYWLLHPSLPYSLAKTLSFICGSIFVYVLNKLVTFKQKQRSGKEMLRFSTLYIGTLMINVSINSICIYLISNALPAFWHQNARRVILFAFLIATSVSTLINFSGQKFWVFKR